MHILQRQEFKEAQFYSKISAFRLPPQKGNKLTTAANGTEYNTFLWKVISIENDN